MQVFYNILFWAAAWGGIHGLVRTMVTMPLQIKSIEDAKKRKSALIDYRNNFLSLIHAIFIIVFSKLE